MKAAQDRAESNEGRAHQAEKELAAEIVAREQIGDKLNELEVCVARTVSASRASCILSCTQASHVVWQNTLVLILDCCDHVPAVLCHETTDPTAFH